MLALVLVGFGTIAIAQNTSNSPSRVSSTGDQTPVMLMSSTPSGQPSQGATSADEPTEAPGGSGTPQMDSKVKKIFDEMAQCMAVQDARNEVLRGFAMRSNAINDQLNHLPPINFDPNLTPEQSQALINERNALQDSLRTQIADINSQELAYEQNSGGGACWQGSGPVPR